MTSSNTIEELKGLTTGPLEQLICIPLKAMANADAQMLETFVEQLISLTTERIVKSYISVDGKETVISSTEYENAEGPFIINGEDVPKEDFYDENEIIYKMKSADFEMLKDKITTQYKIPLAFFLPLDGALGVTEANINFQLNIRDINKVTSNVSTSIFKDTLLNTNAGVRGGNVFVNYQANASFQSRNISGFAASSETNKFTDVNTSYSIDVKVGRLSSNVNKLVDLLEVTNITPVE